MDWDKKWLVDFNSGKTNSTGSIYVKMDGSVLEEKPSFKMLGFTFSCKLDKFTLSRLLKFPPRKFEP